MTRMPAPQTRPYVLTNQIQHYAWGTQNENAFIPKLLGKPVEPNQAYAELWIGAHPKAPSTVKIDGTSIALNDWIATYPVEIMGQAAANAYDNLPFLFKILSAGQALSIQAHPNKSQAEFLHDKDPEHYPDDNHKPEIAIALDHLTALVGFKSLEEIHGILDRYPEISVFMGFHTAESITALIHNNEKSNEDILKEIYSTLLKNSLEEPDQLLTAIQTLKMRLKNSPALSEADELFLESCEIYQDADVGLFSIYLFNLVHFEKGQGIFLDAGIPHAYLKGNIVECMANSDNVIRAGLTPKFKDIETLKEMARYEPGLRPVYQDDPDQPAFEYKVPVPEFMITRRTVHTGDKTEHTGNQLRVVIVLEGQGSIIWNDEQLHIKKGTVLLLPACLPSYRWQSEEKLKLYEASIP